MGLGPEEQETEFDEEIRTHLEMSGNSHERGGLSPAEARRRARIELGGIVQLKEAGRAMRGLPWLETLGLDVRLGLRMMRKSWGLTLVGGLAMTVVMVIAAASFSIVAPNLYGTLPLDEGDRVVALMVWDPGAQRRRRPTMVDFERWRGAIGRTESVSATRSLERNLATSDGAIPEPIPVAEITAAGFELARVAPLVGRPLLPEDEEPGAPAVLVVGYDEWQNRFGADPGIVGRNVRLGDRTHTIVGVMPEGFAFPVNDRYWTPLTAEGDAEVLVFGRLATGMSIEAAAAELSTLGLDPARNGPESPVELETRVVPYARAFSSGEPLERVLISFGVLLISLILVPPVANIAILVYARTIARQREFTTRYALGASRGRIIGQLFIETLLVAACSAAFALVLVRTALGVGFFNSTNDPFWIDYSELSPVTILFAAGLAVFAALVAGGIPAFQATRHTAEAARSPGSGSGYHLGWTWTALVVGQVGLSLALLPTAIQSSWGLVRPSALGPGFAPEQYVLARISLDAPSDDSGTGGEFPRLQAELKARIESVPDVTGVAVSSFGPGLERSGIVLVETPAGSNDPSPRHQVQINRVDRAFFDLFGITVQAGRIPAPDSTSGRSREIAINRALADSIPGTALGSRLRYAGEDPIEWFDVVGIVDDVPRNSGSRRLYHAAADGIPADSIALSVRLNGDAGAFEGRLRAIGPGIDPLLRMDEVRRLDQAYRLGPAGFSAILGTIVATTTASLLLLAAAGLYALTSFTIVRKRREIGIRSALGAQPTHLLAGIFRTTVLQVGTGAAIGLLLALVIETVVAPVLQGISLMGGIGIGDIPGVVPAAGILMFAIGVIAAIGPARQALRIGPNEALRES
jgi:predicted permease